MAGQASLVIPKNKKRLRYKGSPEDSNSRVQGANSALRQTLSAHGINIPVSSTHTSFKESGVVSPIEYGTLTMPESVFPISAAAESVSFS